MFKKILNADKIENSKGKIFWVFVLSLGALGILVLSTYVANLIFRDYIGIGIGIILMIAAVFCHIFGKKRPILYLVSYLLNSVGNGLSLSAYYVFREMKVNIVELFASAIPAAACLLIVYLLLGRLGKSKKFTLIIATVTDLALVALAVIYWIIKGVPSFGFFCLLVALFYICVFGITVNNDSRPFLRDLSFGGFGIFIILTVVVIVIISEGDALDVFDLDLRSDKKKQKKK